jgi:hypothetical protein
LVQTNYSCRHQFIFQFRDQPPPPTHFLFLSSTSQEQTAIVEKNLICLGKVVVKIIERDASFILSNLLQTISKDS